MFLIYQFSGYHALLYDFSHVITVAFVLPFTGLLLVYWWEIKRDEERMLENAREGKVVDRMRKERKVNRERERRARDEKRGKGKGKGGRRVEKPAGEGEGAENASENVGEEAVPE